MEGGGRDLWAAVVGGVAALLSFGRCVRLSGRRHMFGISITKRTPWRGVEEEFSNTYFYDISWQEQGESFLQGLVNQLVTAEKAVHSTQVAFRNARVWTADGTPAENVTIGQFDLSGAGSATDAPSMDREACYLVRFRTSRPSITGRPVTLRKFIHACSLLGGSSTQHAGTSQLAAATITALRTYGEAVRELEGDAGAIYPLVAPSGSGRVAGAVDVFPWIEHHEFRY